jgi:hypothetical protein
MRIDSTIHMPSIIFGAQFAQHVYNCPSNVEKMSSMQRICTTWPESLIFYDCHADEHMAKNAVISACLNDYKQHCKHIYQQSV